MKIGLLTDIHHGDVDVKYGRYFRDSPAKLAAALETFREQQVDFVVQLGDLVDGGEHDRRHLKMLRDKLNTCGATVHHIPGNHDTHFLRKEEISDILESPLEYRSFDSGGCHFVLLDACYRSDGVGYAPYNYEWTDSTIPPPQLEWLRADLAATALPAIVFIHQRLDLPPEHLYSVGNNPEVREVLTNSGKVRAVFQGHRHQSHLAPRDGIPYCTLRALVEGPRLENNAYSVLEVTGDALRLNGYGMQPDCDL